MFIPDVIYLLYVASLTYVSQLTATYVLFELFGFVTDTKHLLLEGVILFDLSCTHFSQMTWSVVQLLAIMDCSEMNIDSVRSLYIAICIYTYILFVFV